jgi:hypothetical protein
MNFDYLQQDADPPYIEATVPKHNALWIALGVVCFAVLIVGAKIYFKESPSAAKAEDTGMMNPATSLAMKAEEMVELSIAKGQYEQISRDPFQSAGRQKAVKQAKHVIHSKPKKDAQKKPSSHLTGQPRLTLKAIVLGARPKAFINDVFVSEGESFEVAGAEKMACQVITIDEQVVKVKVGQKIRVLRLASDAETEKNPWRF